MTQKYTILFDLDGTLVDTAPDLMKAHNYVMKKYGYKTKSTEEIRNLVGQGAGAMLGRSIWGQAKKEFSKIEDEKIKNKTIIEKGFEYKNKSSKFELNKYEENIQKNLTNELSKDLIEYLYNIK